MTTQHQKRIRRALIERITWHYDRANKFEAKNSELRREIKLLRRHMRLLETALEALKPKGKRR